MFFSWFDKNKHFKKGSNLSGQITPFLLIILVILIIAGIATVNIGRVSLDKTCSANAADAGSLAAASAWSSAFNSLAEMNKSMKEYYDQGYYTYGQLYAEADGYITEAIMYAMSGGALGIAAYYSIISNVDVMCFSPWYNDLIGSILDISAAQLMLEASMDVSAFNITVSYMLSITDSFHEYQWKNYCDALDYMQTSYTNARKTGLNYAFSNSCISDKLSNVQSNAFGSWLAADGPFNDGTYSWMDKPPSAGTPDSPPALNPRPSQQHTVSATLDLPDISSYILQPTVGSYSRITTDLLDGLISRSQIISSALYSTATSLGAMGALAMIAFVFSVIAVAYWACCADAILACCASAKAWCLSAKSIQANLDSEGAGIIIIVESLIAVGGSASVYLLQSDNDEAFNDWGPDGTVSSTSCADAQDLMIVQISEVVLPKWKTTCCTTQTHPGTSTGLLATTYPSVKSCSTSKFDGGDVGTFANTYDPSITDVN